MGYSCLAKEESVLFSSCPNMNSAPATQMSIVLWCLGGSSALLHVVHVIGVPG